MAPEPRSALRRRARRRADELLDPDQVTALAAELTRQLALGARVGEAIASVEAAAAAGADLEEAVVRAEAATGQAMELLVAPEGNALAPSGGDELAAALRWWRSKCPLGWSDAQHVASPTVNCSTSAERALAEAVVAQLIAPR